MQYASRRMFILCVFLLCLVDSVCDNQSRPDIIRRRFLRTECHVATMIPGCAPCSTIDPVLKNLKGDGWPIYTWNTVDDMTFYNDWKCSGTPTLILIRDGMEVDRVVGAATEKELLAWFKKFGVTKARHNTTAER